MLEWLKDHFIPHEGNDHKPHMLRVRLSMLVLALMLAVEGFYLLNTLYILPRSDYFAAILASVLVEQTNEKRYENALATLSVNDKLVLAAQMKANDMAARGYFSHNTPDGRTPWYWFREAKYDYSAAGENLAVNFADSKDVTEAWMRSPTHRANIMNGNYTEIGIATARGTYKEREAIFVVQMFGKPSLLAKEMTVRPETVIVPPPAPSPEQVAGASAKVNMKSAETPVAPTPPAPKAPEKLAMDTRPIEEKAPEVLPEPVPEGAPSRSTTVVAGAEIGGTASEEAAPLSTHSIAPHVSFWEALLASPRQAVTIFQLIIAMFIAVVLLLAIFIRIRIQHPQLIANGLLLIAIAIVLVFLNTTINFTQGVI